MDDSLRVYNALITRCEKAGVSILDLGAMQKFLEPGEFHYLLVAMFFGVADNGGFLHAFDSFHLCDKDQFDQVSSAFQELGCLASLQTVAFIRDYLSVKGVDTNELLDDDDGWEKLEELSDDFYVEQCGDLKLNEDALLDDSLGKLTEAGGEDV